MILFFVISAYVLYRPMVDQSPDLRRYAIRRFARIYPAYIVALFASTFPSPAAEPRLLRVARQSICRGVRLPQSWTLQVEVVFYLLLPFVAALIRPTLAQSAAPHALRLPVRRGGLDRPAAINTGPWHFLVPWVFPLGSQRPCDAADDLAAPIGIALLAIGLALEWSQPLDLPVAIAGVLVVLGIRDFRSPPAAMAGTRLSYPVYLWHVTVFALSPTSGSASRPLVVSALSWILVERPSQAFRFRRGLARATDPVPIR